MRSTSASSQWCTKQRACPRTPRRCWRKRSRSTQAIADPPLPTGSGGTAPKLLRSRVPLSHEAQILAPALHERRESRRILGPHHRPEPFHGIEERRQRFGAVVVERLDLEIELRVLSG